MNGIRRPHLLRYRSLLTETAGPTSTPKTFGMMLMNRAVVLLLAPRWSIMYSGKMPSTPSISVKQKSPHSSHANRTTRPLAV